MFDDDDHHDESENKQADSAANMRDRQRRALDEDVRKNRREMLQSRRMTNMLRAADPSQQHTLGFSLSHLEHTPNGELLRPKIIEWTNEHFSPESMHIYMTAIDSDDLFQQHFGIIHLRRILAIKNHQPIQTVMDHPVFFKIVRMARDEVNLHLQLEATWCLANLASGTTEQTMSLVQKNVVSLFADLIRSPYSQISEQAIWGIGNISGDCVEFRNKVMASHAPEALLEKAGSPIDENILNLIIWVLSNLCRLRNSKSKVGPIEMRMLEVLKNGFKSSQNQDVLNDCLHGLFNSAKAESNHIFADFDFLLKLQRYYTEIQTSYQSKRSLMSAIHTFLGGFTSNCDEYVLLMLKVGFLTVLKNSLFINDLDNLREVCWVMSNLAIGSIEQVKALVSEHLLLETLLKISSHSNLLLAKEATWTLCNLCLAKDEGVIQTLFEKGILEMFKSKMDPNVDIKMTSLVLEGVIHLLEFYAQLSREEKLIPFVKYLMAEGVAKCIESLQFHQSDLIYLKAHMILETYFPVAN